MLRAVHTRSTVELLPFNEHQGVQLLPTATGRAHMQLTTISFPTVGFTLVFLFSLFHLLPPPQLAETTSAYGSRDRNSLHMETTNRQILPLRLRAQGARS